MREPRKVISVVVPSRTHVDPDKPLLGAEGIAFLEQLRADTYAMAGVDVRAPMRRDLVRLVRFKDASEEDF